MSDRIWSRRDDTLVRVVSPEVAAAKLGLDLALIRARREQLKLLPATAQQEPWDLRPSQQLARRYLRQTAKRERRVRTNLWTAEQDEAVCWLSLPEAVAKTGRTLGAVKSRRSVLSARGEPMLDLRTVAERTKAGRSIWTPEADEVVRSNRPFIAARLLQVSTHTIASRRKALGLPKCVRMRKAVADRPKRAPRYRWTPEEDQLLLRHTPREVSQRTGRTIQAINYRRITLRAAGIPVKVLSRGRSRNYEGLIPEATGERTSAPSNFGPDLQLVKRHCSIGIVKDAR